MTLKRGRRVNIVGAITREGKAVPLGAVRGSTGAEQDPVDAVTRNLRVCTRVKQTVK